MPGFSISRAQGKAIIVSIFVLHTFFTEPVSHVNKLFMLKLQLHRYQSLIVYIVPWSTPVFFTFLTPKFVVLTTVYYFCSGYINNCLALNVNWFISFLKHHGFSVYLLLIHTLYFVSL
jgi:hypothetical protein